MRSRASTLPSAKPLSILLLPLLASVWLSAGLARDVLPGPAAVPEVRVATGVVRGVSVGGGTAAFKGVPFAQPPVGPLRWRPPVPPVPWHGVYDATKFKPACMQKLDAVNEIGPVAEGIHSISEDCLYLNIWAPLVKPAKPLPVMVWVYGGAFKYGAASVPMYDGAQLARDGVIVVTFNYRLGVFGFLAHPGLTAQSPHHSSGNYGLLDQLAALRWVRENIRAFGGDPKRVTAFGQSAGASSIAYLMLSPLSKGLFERAILQSPAIFRPLATLPAAESAGERALGSGIGRLRAMPAAQLLKRNEAFAVKPNRAAIGPRTIGPILDGWVLQADETASYSGGGGLRIPVVIGGNTGEGWLFVRNWTIRSVDAYQAYLQKNFGSYAAAAAGVWPVTRDDQALHAVSDLNGDLHFQYGIRQFSRLLANAGVPVYCYHFTRRRAGTGPAPTHEDEINYVFGHIPANDGRYDGDDRLLSARMQRMWASFARSGTPDTGTAIRWPRLNAAGDDYLRLDTPLAVRAGYRQRQLDFIEGFAKRAYTSAE